jgi:hypothetical protein
MKIFSRFADHHKDASAAWKTIQKNWVIDITNKFVLVLFTLSIILVIWRWNLLPPSVPIWYSRPWGADQLAHPLWLFMFPVASLVCYVLNRALSIYLISEHLIFTQILFISSLFVSVLSFVAVVKILFLVT